MAVKYLHPLTYQTQMEWIGTTYSGVEVHWRIERFLQFHKNYNHSRYMQPLWF